MHALYISFNLHKTWTNLVWKMENPKSCSNLLQAMKPQIGRSNIWIQVFKILQLVKKWFWRGKPRTFSQFSFPWEVERDLEDFSNSDLSHVPRYLSDLFAYKQTLQSVDFNWMFNSYTFKRRHSCLVALWETAHGGVEKAWTSQFSDLPHTVPGLGQLTSCLSSSFLIGNMATRPSAANDPKYTW